MEVLPPEVWVDILGWVDGAADVVRFGLTCRAANVLATDPSLWRTLCPRLLFPSCAGQVRRAVEAQAGVERAKVAAAVARTPPAESALCGLGRRR
ncbi:uncharacterized protein ACA1_353980 [Acanthamoeba castellanii str. Neff]|uniref:F-box domain-containing protein n=1 Tax=Acanthamoeba castellanii (strain ATCC 30010 / Neff) TaxID=1257118 RepID=L8GCU0_ACACF|nr:uncharacterized protein ACA1_353980 [Acanthamoeba castellanii str. Neff]ELR10990.1 hypothetical protein ACA1_353980 [Acanthamoeba castellanii str. Neff]